MADKHLPRKTRSDGEQSRERLLLAAMQLFAAQGYAKTSTREIALAAGANVAAISYYFGDKAGLYRAALTDFKPPENLAAFTREDITLRKALGCYYGQMLAPMLEGQAADLMLRMWLREVLEPTGIWQDKVYNGIRPQFMALAGMLARHVGVPVDDEIYRLAHAIAGLGVHLMMARDVIDAVTPHLLVAPDPLQTWIDRLTDYAEALVAAEQNKRNNQTKGAG